VAKAGIILVTKGFGEELGAWIRLRPGEAADVDDIQAFRRGQIAHHEIPRYLRFVGAYPMTVTGKDPEVRHPRPNDR